MSRLLVIVLMLTASLPLSAREVKLAGANGDGGSCPDTAAEESLVPVAREKTAPPASMPAKAKSAPFRGGSEAGALRMPRWHSFVPGMIR